MTTLTLYERPAEGSDIKVDLQDLFNSWKRSKRAIGGYHLGKLAIKNRGMPELTDFYNTWLGYKIVENTFGITSYEGIVWQLDLVKNGANYRRTLNPKHWHNRVKVKYTNPNGDPSTVDWSENTDSSGIYGEMEYVYAIGETTSGGATALRDRALEEYAWPKSRTMGGINVGEPTPSLRRDGLYVTTAGFQATMNWQYRETSETAGASTLLATLIGETEFVTAGRLETNALSVRVGADPIPQRIGDLIFGREGILEQSDASGNLWKAGVYANQEFVYEQVPTTVDYILQNGALYRAGVVVEFPSLINPGFYVRDTNAPAGYQPPGTSNIWDDPQVSYCNEVEFTWPDKLILKFPGERQSVEAVLPPNIPLAWPPEEMLNNVPGPIGPSVLPESETSIYRFPKQLPSKG